ncbi:MAG: DUF5655 domain-containing protein [Gemmataceae bacterium]
MAKSKPAEYQVHPGVGMVKKWVDALPEKTGKTIEEWSLELSRLKFPDSAARRAWLKSEHGFGTNEASWMAEYSQGKHTWDFVPEIYLEQARKHVEAQYAGPKTDLKPILDAILDFARGLGDDIRICPCKTMVPIYRNRVFAEVRPATRTRVELALALDETPMNEPFVANPRARGNDRLRHLLCFHELKDFNATAKKWLKKAYALDEGKKRSLGG